MHNERIAVSEFQTWADETFGELMNAMANGYVAISKGNVHTRRETCTNYSSGTLLLTSARTASPTTTPIRPPCWLHSETTPTRS